MSPSPTELAAWLAVAFFLAAGVNQIWKLIDRAKDKPPPDEILQRVSREFAPRTMVEGLRGELHTLRDETHHAFEHQTKILKQEMDDNRRERKEDVGDLHEKINEVAKSCAALEATDELSNQRLLSMDSKLDRLIERRLPR